MKLKLTFMMAALALSTPAHAADSDIPTWNGTEKEEAYAACLVGRTIIYFDRNPVIDQQAAMAKAKENCGEKPDTLEGNARFDDFMAFAVGDWIAKKFLQGKDEPAPAHAAEFKPDPTTKITCSSSSDDKDNQVTITAKFDKKDPQKILSMEVTGRPDFRQTGVKQVTGQPAWGWTGKSIHHDNEEIVGVMSHHGKWRYIEQLYEDNQPTASSDYPNCHKFEEVAEAESVPKVEEAPLVEETKPPAPTPPPVRIEPKAAPEVEDYKPAPREPPLTMEVAPPAPEEHQRHHRQAAPRRDYARPRREAAPRWQEQAPLQEKFGPRPPRQHWHKYQYAQPRPRYPHRYEQLQPHYRYRYAQPQYQNHFGPRPFPILPFIGGLFWAFRR
jgi:hypothetical protein